MKLMIGIFVAFGMIALAGCANPPYSYDVRGNGEGGVVVTTVPYREEPWRQTPPPTIIYIHDAPTTAPAPAPTPAPVVTTLPAPPPPTPTPAPVVSTLPAPQSDEQQRIADLEARLKDLAAENAKLKAQLQNAPTTMPATNP